MERDSARLWAMIEASRPEIWPGSQPWEDAYGSFGTLPDADGLGASVLRVRVPPGDLAGFLETLWLRYQVPPRFTVGPFETPGLTEWLSGHGYLCEMVEEVLVLAREHWPQDPLADVAVREASHLADFEQTVRLDHLVFDEPLLAGRKLVREWGRYGRARRLFLVPGEDGIARASGGYTDFGPWLLLFGGATHPAYRRHGLYSAVVRARLDAARTTSGSAFAAVYANRGTSAPILERLGFAAIGTVTVWGPVRA